MVGSGIKQLGFASLCTILEPSLIIALRLYLWAGKIMKRVVKVTIYES
jgi:hypothetical protein